MVPADFPTGIRGGVTSPSPDRRSGVCIGEGGVDRVSWSTPLRLKCLCRWKPNCGGDGACPGVAGFGL